MQTKTGSFIEAWANVAVGFIVSFFMNLYILPLFGLTVSPAKAFWIGVVYTVISIIRSYWLRRFFNYIKLWNIRNADAT